MSTDRPSGNAKEVSVVYTPLSSIYQPDTGEDVRMAGPPGCWTPSEARERINECAGRSDLELNYALIIEPWMKENGLATGDLLHLLSTGYVYGEPEESSRGGYFKYTIEGLTPNCNGRTLIAVIIPSGCFKIKVNTLAWKD